MNALVIPPSGNLIDSVFENLVHSGVDFSSNLIIFPGKRPSHFLRKKIATEYGKAFIPPRIFSLDIFIDTVFEKCISNRKEKLETIDAVSILYDINKRAKAPFGGPGFLKPDLFFPLGMKLFNDLEELLIEEVKPAKVREVDFEFFEEAISGDMQERLETLSAFYETFYTHLKKNNLSTRATRYSEVSRLESLCELERFAKIIAAGFFVFTKAEKRLMQKVFKKKQTLFIFHNGPGVKRSIEKLGGSIQYGEGRTEPNPQRPKYHFIKSPDTHGQVSALNHALQYLLAQKKLDEKTFIMLPAPETLFPLINHTLPTIGEGKYNISLGFPLKRTPVFGFFANLMEVISSFDRGRVYVPHYLKFILHPYTKNIYFEKSPEVTRIMFHELELLLTKNRSKLFIDLTDIEQMNLPAFDEASSEGEAVISKKIAAHLQTIHKNTICMFTNIKNTGDFAEKGVRLISYIYKQSTAILHPFFHPFAENFIEALTTISRSMAKEIVFDSCLGYFHFVKNYLNTVHTPFEGVPLKGVQIVGFLETRNLQPERIFVVDLNEGVLPEKRGENSLIPFKVRKYLGIPTYSDHEKISSYYFETLTKGTKEVFLYFIENKKKEKSRFVEKLLWEEEKREKGIRGQGGSLVEGVQYSLSLETEKRDPVQKSDEMISYLNDFTFSATSLDVYLRCPLRFYYQYVLNVREREEAPELIEASQVGLFVHKALQVLFEKKLGIPLTKDHFTAFEIETTVDRLFAKQFSPEITGTLYILKKQITRQLKNFFKNYQIPRILTTSTIVTDVEMRLQSRYQGYLIKGTIDRVERQGEELTIIDYKSSSNAALFKPALERIDLNQRETWGEAISSIQLPFYILLYSQVAKADITFLNGKILLLGKNVIDEKIEVSLFSGEASKEEQFKLYEKVLSGLLSEITNPNVPFSPAPDRKKKCPGCKYESFCGA